MSERFNARTWQPVAVATFSVHASWLSESEVEGEAVSKVSHTFRPGDEGLCAWVDEREPRRFLVSFDVESDTHATAARDCLALVVQVPQIESRLGMLEEVGATDEEGYLVVKSEDFEELRGLTE